MAYHLVHRYGLTEAPQYGNETFSTEMEAIDRASERFAVGDPGDFVIEKGHNASHRNPRSGRIGSKRRAGRA